MAQCGVDWDSTNSIETTEAGSFRIGIHPYGYEFDTDLAERGARQKGAASKKGRPDAAPLDL
jgi:hypothetical protein